MKGGLKEPYNPFTDSLCQRGEVTGVGSGVRCSTDSLCVVVVKHLTEVFDFGLHPLDLCVGGLDSRLDIGVVTV